MSIDKFKTMEPAKYYDCGGDFTKPKAQEMLLNSNRQYIATRKYDGEWCRIIIDEKGEVLLQSRSISKVTGKYGDKTEHVPHIVSELKKWYPKDSVFLGELCFIDDKKTSRDVGTILRCLPKKAVERQKKEPLSIKIFDCLRIEGKDIYQSAYIERIEHLKRIDSSLDYDINYVSAVIFYEDNFIELLERILGCGGEGIMICNKNAPYRPGKRTAWETLKVKKKLPEYDVLVVGLVEPKRNYEGDSTHWDYVIDGEKVTKAYYKGWKVGVVVDFNGKEVKVTSGATDEDKEFLSTKKVEQLIQNKELYATVSGMEITPDGSIRHPHLLRLRLDITE